MFKDQQYHELIRKTIVAFGTLFNDLYIYRRSSTGKVTQKMKVPLAYGPKQKFIARIDQDTARSASDPKTTALTLPRIGFELTGLTYDPSRKLNRIQKFRQGQQKGRLPIFLNSQASSTITAHKQPFLGEQSINQIYLLKSVITTACYK